MLDLPQRYFPMSDRTCGFLQGFPENESDDPSVLIGWIGDATERARVAQYALLARANERHWLDPKHLQLILAMCQSAERTGQGEGQATPPGQLPCRFSQKTD